jgi:hypothetical protein
MRHDASPVFLHRYFPVPDKRIFSVHDGDRIRKEYGKCLANESTSVTADMLSLVIDKSTATEADMVRMAFLVSTCHRPPMQITMLDYSALMADTAYDFHCRV